MKEKQAFLYEFSSKKNGTPVLDIQQRKKKQVTPVNLNQSDVLPLIYRRIGNIKKPSAYSMHLTAEQTNMIQNLSEKKESQHSTKPMDIFNRDHADNKVKRIGTVKPTQPFTMVVQKQPNSIIKRQQINKRSSLSKKQNQDHAYQKKISNSNFVDKIKKIQQQKNKQKQNQPQVLKKKNKILKKGKKIKQRTKKQNFEQKTQKQPANDELNMNKQKQMQKSPCIQRIDKFLQKNRLNVSSIRKQKSYHIVVNMVSNREQVDQINSQKSNYYLPEIKKSSTTVQYKCSNQVTSQKSFSSTQNNQRKQSTNQSSILKPFPNKMAVKHISTNLIQNKKSLQKLVNAISKKGKISICQVNPFQDKVDSSRSFFSKTSQQKNDIIIIQKKQDKKILTEQKNSKIKQFKDKRSSYQKPKLNYDSSHINNGVHGGYLKKYPINQLTIKQKFIKSNQLRKQSNARPPKQMKIHDYLFEAKQMCKGYSINQ